MDYKQPAIVDELKRRISSGFYADMLPSGEAMAAEFGVNVKTMNKALARLVAAGLLERRRRCGTRVRQAHDSSFTRLIEVIFEGFTTVFSHPYWSAVWDGLVEQLARHGYQVVLNLLESDPETGLLKLGNFQMCRSAGKVVMGIGEQRLLNMVKSENVPCIAGCDALDDPEFPQVTVDFTRAMGEAVDFLAGTAGRRIGFLGQLQSFVNSGGSRKFLAYSNAVQKYDQLHPELLANARPLLGEGRRALAAMLDRGTVPDGLIVAYDHLLPEVFSLLRERGVAFPVIGCDGLTLSGIPLPRRVVSIPRRKCGEAMARSLVAALEDRTRARSFTLAAQFMEIKERNPEA